MKRLDGKICLVTGGGSGIGKATCLRLANEGGSVAVTDLDEADAKSVCEEITSQGGTADFWPLDVADADAVPKVFDAVAEKFGQIDVVGKQCRDFRREYTDTRDQRRRLAQGD